MNTKYGIKNFRVFDREGATFEIAPLTILTGCNSSGKSSMVKSMMLLGNYLKKIRMGFQHDSCTPSRYPLEFFGSDMRLGGFDNVRNKKSNPDEPITFSFYSPSFLLCTTLKVEMSFKSSSKDTLNSGWLSDFALYMEDGTMLLKAIVKDDRVSFVDGNLLPFIGMFFHCVRYELLQILEYNTEPVTREQYIEINKKVEQYRNELGIFEQYFDLANNSLGSLYIHFGAGSPKVLETIENQETLFAMPALTELADVHKEDIMEKTTILLEKKQKGFGYDFEKEKTAYRLNRIAQDFMASDFDTFLDYFLYWEEKEWASTFSGSFLEAAEGLFKEYFFGLSRDTIRGFSYSLFDEATVEGDKWYISSEDFKKRPEKEKRRIKYQYKKDLQRLEQEKENWQKDKEEISFRMIWETLFSCSIYDLEKREETIFMHSVPYFFENQSCFYFITFIKNVIKEALLPYYSLEYVGSAAATVKRLYSFDAEEGTLEGKIKRYVNLIRDSGKKNSGDFEPGAFINKWIQKFGIGHSISFDQVEDGLGVSLHLHADENDSKGHLLADEGYGITQLLSSLISIEIQIMSPLEKRSFSTISIEEPEIHLHPRYQSLLAEMFVNAYKKYNIHFIIETHSEYLIRKLQTYIPKGQVNEEEGLKPEEISLYYFYDPDPTKRPKNEPQIKKIGFRKDGSLDSAFGSGFFDEADNLAMSLLLGN